MLAIKEAQNNLISYAVVIHNGNYNVNWHHKLIADKLQQAYEKVKSGKRARIILQIPPRHGKQIDNETPVLTLEGFKKHGEIKVGDFVYDCLGEPVKVLAVSEETFCDYKIQFSDGSIFYTHSNHEWIVYDRKKNWKNRKRILETKEIAKNNLSLEGERGKRGHRYRFSVDWNIPIKKFKRKRLKIHPYILGVWLGDGCRNGGVICGDIKDKAIIDKVVKLGGNLTAFWKHKKTGVNYYSFTGLYPKLRKYGLNGKKFIPKDYLFSSFKKRLELLAGLIDTDGCIDNNSRYIISTCDEELAKNIKQLVISLGSRAYIQKYQPITSSSGIIGRKIVYTIGFNLNFKIPVSLKRKKNKRKSIRRKRSIISLEKVKTDKKGKCIQVEGGNYLIGENLIPTHNSDLASIKFPSWVLGKSPKMNIVVTSYAQNLADDFGLATRDLMNEAKYKAIFNTKLREDIQAKAKWKTDEGGSYTAVGIGGALTGKGFSIGIVDDFLKNREEADSYLIREQIWKWYRSTFLTREDGNGAVIVIGARWHDDDLIGRIITQAKEQGNLDEWEIIKIPAIAEEDEEFRKKGEAMWKWRFPLEVLEQKRKDIGIYEFASLFQQNPVDEASQEFKKEWLKYREWDEVSKLNVRIFVTIDPALSSKKENDYTGVVINYRDQENKWNIKANRYKLNSSELINLIFKIHAETNFEKLGIEQGPYDETIRPFLEEEMRKRGIFFTVETLKHRQQSKELRIRGLIPLYANGQIFHIKNYCYELEEEIFRFPKGRNDDTLDALAYQLQTISSIHSTGELPEPKTDFDPY